MGMGHGHTGVTVQCASGCLPSFCSCSRRHRPSFPQSRRRSFPSSRCNCAGCAAQNPRLADRLSRLLENPRRVLSALLLADAMVNVPSDRAEPLYPAGGGPAAGAVRTIGRGDLRAHRHCMRSGTEDDRAWAALPAGEDWGARDGEAAPSAGPRFACVATLERAAGGPGDAGAPPGHAPR